MSKRKDEDRSGPIIFGSVVIFFGLMWLLSNLGIFNFSLAVWWPVFVIGLGGMIIFNELRK